MFLKFASFFFTDILQISFYLVWFLAVFPVYEVSGYSFRYPFIQASQVSVSSTLNMPREISEYKESGEMNRGRSKTIRLISTYQYDKCVSWAKKYKKIDFNNTDKVHDSNETIIFRQASVK